MLKLKRRPKPYQLRACPRCGARWQPRKAESVKCPRCWTVLR